jgi:hypothetical protein
MATLCTCDEPSGYIKTREQPSTSQQRTCRTNTRAGCGILEAADVFETDSTYTDSFLLLFQKPAPHLFTS